MAEDGMRCLCDIILQSTILYSQLIATSKAPVPARQRWRLPVKLKRAIPREMFLGPLGVILGLYRDDGKENGNYCTIMLNLRVLAAADRQTTLHIGCLLGKPVSRPQHCPAHHSFNGHVDCHAEQKCNSVVSLSRAARRYLMIFPIGKGENCY